jgi:hypothetical protein
MAFEKPIKQAQRWDIVIQQGSTFERSMTFVGMTFDSILGFRGQIRATHESTDVLAEFACTTEGDNILHLRIEAGVTATLPPGRLVHDIEAYLPQDVFVARVLEGRVTVTPEVTRG